jgi:hypothetical protein
MEYKSIIENYDFQAPNSCYISIFGKDIIQESKTLIKPNQSNDEIKKIIFDSISMRIRELFRADNFSILTGAGSSFNIGGVLFSKKELELTGWVGSIFNDNTNELKEEYNELLKLYENHLENKNCYGVEDFITFLVKLEYCLNKGGIIELEIKNKKTNCSDKVSKIKNLILDKLTKSCALPVKEKQDALEQTKTFIKRILSRPVNLRRTNLFTTNYDLAFEKSMDGLGVIYVDGFIGGLKKYFHPEAFNFDFYYPSSTTEGKVSRLERVLHFYKLHGSLNWVVSDDNSFMNVYNIEKKESEIIEYKQNLIIYPTPMKENDTLGYPYSELFRRFANTIQQPQSVLLTYGYSFGDPHINRIIFEALSIPSFQLIIISHSWSDNIKNIYNKYKNEPSIGFIIGEEFAKWDIFVKNILPDFPSQDLEEQYQTKRSKARTLNEELNLPIITEKKNNE